jgi:peptidoglycan/LPS O-acetylase OafA/YrhL
VNTGDLATAPATALADAAATAPAKAPAKPRRKAPAKARATVPAVVPATALVEAPAEASPEAPPNLPARAPARSSTRAAFRPDLEGLRGVAILLVVLCHVGIPGAGAGFIGVDVFFVLSGFLITGLLVGEYERNGRLDLRAFYARRARRIVPAAVLVLACTLLAAQMLVSPLDLPGIADDVLAAGLSVANIHFALQATDYFAPVDASPVLHYWSLGVEEQFYLLWPLILIAASRLARPRVAMTIATGLILVGSFVLSNAMTASEGPWAYYSLPTRAWQLAAGGLLALAAPLFSRLPGFPARVVGWLGAGLLVAALAVIEPTTEYPGLAALLPTLGAVAIIASGGGAGSPGSMALTLAPMRWLGRISYSLYLWHWPILVLGSVALGVGVGGIPIDEAPAGADIPAKIGLVLLAIVVAWGSWALVEEPVRRARGWRVGPLRGFGLAGAAVLSLVIASATLGIVAGQTVATASVDGGAYVDDPTFYPTLGTDEPDTEPSSVASPITTQSTEPPAPPTASPRPSPTPGQPAASRTSGALPEGLVPSLGRARNDGDPLLGDGCALSLAGTRPPACVYGDPHGKVTVALVGDSHAQHWFPALDLIARRQGWRLVPLTKFSCVFVDMRIWSPNLKREYTECETWRENVVDRLVQLRPDLVIISSNRWLPVVNDSDTDPERQGDAMARLIRRIHAPVAIIVDTPRSEFDVPACLAAHRTAIEECVTSRSAALTWRHLRREKQAARETGATLVDMSKAICPSDPCPPIIGNRLVYRDNHHLTATFARALAGALAAALPVITPR